MTEITRRRLLAAAPAVPFLAGPAFAGSGEIEKKMHEWIDVSVVSWPRGVSDEVSNAYFESAVAPLQNAIEKMPATSYREMLAKLVVSTRGFEFEAQGTSSVEIMRMLGVEETFRRLYGPDWFGWPENAG